MHFHHSHTKTHTRTQTRASRTKSILSPFSSLSSPTSTPIPLHKVLSLPISTNTFCQDTEWSFEKVTFLPTSKCPFPAGRPFVNILTRLRAAAVVSTATAASHRTCTAATGRVRIGVGTPVPSGHAETVPRQLPRKPGRPLVGGWRATLLDERFQLGRPSQPLWRRRQRWKQFFVAERVVAVFEVVRSRNESVKERLDNTTAGFDAAAVLSTVAEQAIELRWPFTADPVGKLWQLPGYNFTVRDIALSLAVKLFLFYFLTILLVWQCNGTFCDTLPVNLAPVRLGGFPWGCNEVVPALSRGNSFPRCGRSFPTSQAPQRVSFLHLSARLEPSPEPQCASVGH